MTCLSLTRVRNCDLQETAATAEQVAAAAAAAAAALPKHTAALEALPPAESFAAVEAVKALATNVAAAHAAIAAAAQGDVGKQQQRRRTPAEVAALLQDAAGGPLAASVERSSSAPVALPPANSGACPLRTHAPDSASQWYTHAERLSPHIFNGAPRSSNIARVMDDGWSCRTGHDAVSIASPCHVLPVT